jgi:glucosamine-phosphate N-acetyltransferase
MTETNGTVDATLPTTSPIIIRPMVAPDLKRGFLETIGSLRPSRLTHEQAVEVFRKRMRQQVHTYVALIDNVVVGTASVMIEQKFIHDGGAVGHIEDVAVNQSYQGRGIGALLIKRIMQHCHETGCYKVILDCAEKVMPFYEKLGFHKWERAMRIDLPAAPKG